MRNSVLRNKLQKGAFYQPLFPFRSTQLTPLDHAFSIQPIAKSMRS